MIKIRESIFFGPLLVIASMVSLTLGASLAKNLFPLLGPAGTTFLRLGIGACLLLIAWQPWRAGRLVQNDGEKIPTSKFRIIILYGLILGAMNLTFYQAISRLPIGIAIAIEFLGPLSVSLFYSRSRLDFVWALLALVGIILILPLSSSQTSIDLIGVAYALFAAGCWASYILVGKKAGANINGGLVTTMGMSIGCLAVLPFGLLPAMRIFQDVAFIPSALAVGLLSSAIPYSLEMKALKHIDSKNFGILLSLEPAIGGLMAFVFLSERLTLLQCFAVGCVIAASVGSTVMAARKRPKAPQDLAF